MKFGKIFSSLAPYLAAAAFVFLVLAFYVSIGVYRLSVYKDAKRELETRAELAAMTLAEPLRTQDFAAVRAFGDVCRARGYELSVRASGGGRIFDTRRNPVDSTEHWLSAEASSGEYVVWLIRSRKEVFAPFRRTYRLFVLAALAGAAGVFVFFFALYRQRIRIRELARTEKFRREFVADVSHEIKTPLTGILGAAEMLSEGDASEAQKPLLSMISKESTRLNALVPEMLSEGDASEAQKPLLSMISKESTRLNALVQQILDLARLEREGEALDLAETDLVDLARESVDLMRPRAEAAGIALSFAAPESPCVAKVDARLIGEAIGNLVSNAIRHSGSPDVAVSVSRSARGFAIAVEDHGIGIPPEHAERVFERFHRVDPARASESGGAGLGLAIARRIARLHGGDVVLSPAVPSGARFVLSVRGGRSDRDGR